MADMPNKELLEQYAQLKIKEKQIEQEMEMIKPKVLAEIKAISTDQPVQVGDFGTFSITKKKIWQYSTDLMDLKARVTEQEKEEKQTGTATIIDEQEILIFKQTTQN